MNHLLMLILTLNAKLKNYPLNDILFMPKSTE